MITDDTLSTNRYTGFSAGLRAVSRTTQNHTEFLNFPGATPLQSSLILHCSVAAGARDILNSKSRYVGSGVFPRQFPMRRRALRQSRTRRVNRPLVPMNSWPSGGWKTEICTTGGVGSASSDWRLMRDPWVSERFPVTELVSVIFTPHGDLSLFRISEALQRDFISSEGFPQECTECNRARCHRYFPCLRNILYFNAEWSKQKLCIQKGFELRGKQENMGIGT